MCKQTLTRNSSSILLWIPWVWKASRGESCNKKPSRDSIKANTSKARTNKNELELNSNANTYMPESLVTTSKFGMGWFTLATEMKAIQGLAPYNESSSMTDGVTYKPLQPFRRIISRCERSECNVFSLELIIGNILTREVRKEVSLMRGGRCCPFVGCQRFCVRFLPTAMPGNDYMQPKRLLCPIATALSCGAGQACTGVSNVIG